jgi:hypothetical protein
MSAPGKLNPGISDDIKVNTIIVSLICNSAESLPGLQGFILAGSYLPQERLHVYSLKNSTQ